MYGQDSLGCKGGYHSPGETALSVVLNHTASTQPRCLLAIERGKNHDRAYLETQEEHHSPDEGYGLWDEVVARFMR